VFTDIYNLIFFLSNYFNTD